MIKDLEPQDCKKVLRSNYIGRLAYIAEEEPFVIPITYYFYNEDNNSIISYSLEGHKITSMRKKPSVSLQVEEIESVSKWKSILVHGEFEELSGSHAKKILHKFSQGVRGVINNKEEKELKFINEFSSKLDSKGASPIVYRINIIDITGKYREE